jgi:Fungal specific transcription factor domain
LIRFEWCTAEPEEPTRKTHPKVLPTTPESQLPTPLPTNSISLPSTPDAIESNTDSVPDEDVGDDVVARITKRATTEAFHLVRAWPLSNGTGFATRDLPYVHFFMNQMGNYLWFAGITSPVSRYIMAKALEQPVLHHAVLCTSAALLSERTLTGPGRYLEHKQHTLTLLRGHLDRLDINESVAAAVFFMLFVDIGEAGARSHLRGLKSVLDYLKQQSEKKEREGHGTSKEVQLPKPEFNNPDITGVSPLAWLIWAWGIRMDIGMATIDGAPMVAPLPAGPETEPFHRSWISCLSDPTIPDSADWGLANFTLDNIMHRGCHVAKKARIIRSSPNYRPEHELKIHRLCQQIDDDLEKWKSRPILEQTKIKEEAKITPEFPPEYCFLHYPPLIIDNPMYSNLMADYRTAKLYMSLVKYPNPGPNPPGSGRYQHAVEICRVFASKPLFERDNVRGAEEAMCLFLAGVVFGGDEYYPMESRWVQNKFKEYFPIYTGTTPERLLGIWLENCPCVPMVREKNFPWTLLGTLGVQSLKSGDNQYDGEQHREVQYDESQYSDDQRNEVQYDGGMAPYGGVYE